METHEAQEKVIIATFKVLVVVACLLLLATFARHRLDADDPNTETTVSTNESETDHLSELNESVNNRNLFNIGYIAFGDGVIPVKAELYADSFTHIVYIYLCNSVGGFTEYLSPTGMPYSYDTVSNTLIPLPAYEGQVIQEDWVIRIEDICN